MRLKKSSGGIQTSFFVLWLSNHVKLMAEDVINL
jgi:hypothetical protein